MDIRRLRLRAHGLAGPGFDSPLTAVGALGAVQAQDHAGAKWALAARSGVPEEEVDALYDAGAIVRTHVLRPTWHFALAEDIAWLLALTGPRVRAGLTGRHRVLEVDGPTIAAAETAITNALAGGRHLTRQELATVLTDAGIPVDSHRLAHLILCAELDGLIVSGPRRGRQHTYGLLEERVPRARARDPEEAAAELAARYFSSHGPAQLHDFVWWSGLRVADARRALAAAAPELERVVIEGRELWLGQEAEADAELEVRLLQNWDEYTVAYRDRRDIEPEVAYDAAFFPFASILANVLVAGGRVAGTWSWTRGARDLVTVRALRRLSTAELTGLEAEAERMASFRGRPVDLSVAAVNGGGMARRG